MTFEEAVNIVWLYGSQQRNYMESDTTELEDALEFINNRYEDEVNKMKIKSYGKFRDFEIRDFSKISTNVSNSQLLEGDYELEVVDAEKEGRYDLVKWIYDKGKPQYCFSIGELIWNDNEDYFDFKSCGIQFLEYGSEDLNNWLLKWIELKTFERCKGEE